MTIPFTELAQLLEHDPYKMQRVVWEFYRLVSKDLRGLEHAAAAHQWQTVRQLARRIQVSCLQVGDRDAAQAAAALASISGELFADAYHHRRPQILESLERAERFVSDGLAARTQCTE